MKSQKLFFYGCLICSILYFNYSFALSVEDLDFKLPYKSGDMWYITCAYNGTGDCSTHGSGTDNRYALDFNFGVGNEDCGKEIIAIAPGRAEVHTGYNGGYGNYVDIFHGDGYVSRYAHLEDNSISVYQNKWVFQGEPIGKCGTTGNSNYCHLHFALYRNGDAALAEPMSGYNNFISYGYYLSNNSSYPEIQNWDNICKMLSPNLLVERFRNSSTGKIEVNQTPIDNRIYYYSDGLCGVDYYTAYVMFSGEGGPCLDLENCTSSDPNDPNPTTPEPPDPDIHINSLDIRFPGGDYVKEIQKTLYWGQSFQFEGRAEFENKSSAEAKDIDADYRITDSRSNFNEDATKIDEDGLFNINPGSREENSISKITVTVSTDGTKVYYSQGSMTKSFDVINGFSKVYIFADIEVDGDKDISSPSDHDEYGKIELIIQKPPCQPSFTQTPTSGTRPLTVSFTNTSISNSADCTYTWSFGDGGTTNVYHPAYTYNTAGTYTPKLTGSSYSYSYSTTKNGNTISITNPIPPSMMITNPTGNDNWRSDNTKHITWNRSNFPTQGNARIDYTMDGGNVWRNIDTVTPNDGSRYWNMCSSYTIDSGNSYIRICSLEYGVCATSARFYIDHAKGCK